MVALRGADAMALELVARGLEQLAEGHSRGTGRLAAATAEAEVEVRDGRVGQGKASLGERLDEEDPASRRIRLRAENGKGRAIGEAEAAMHAAVEIDLLRLVKADDRVCHDLRDAPDRTCT